MPRCSLSWFILVVILITLQRDGTYGTLTVSKKVKPTTSQCMCKPGIPGVNGVPGIPGPPGPKGPKGHVGLFIRGPKGYRGAPGNSAVKGEEGPRGNKGASGFPGVFGQDGRPGDQGPRGRNGNKGQKGETFNTFNWHQCTWNSEKNVLLSTQGNPVQTCEFSKRHPNTAVKLSFQSHLGGDACVRWYFKFNGQECRRAGPIEAYILPSNPQMRSHNFIQGYCDNLPVGSVNVSLHVQNCPGATNANKAYFGYDRSHSAIMIEEITT